MNFGRYSPAEQVRLGNMSLTDQTLLSEAAALVNAASTPAERNARKRDLFAFLYGNSQPLKAILDTPFKEVK